MAVAMVGRNNSAWFAPEGIIKGEVTKSDIRETETILDDFGLSRHTIPKSIDSLSALLRWRKSLIDNALA